MEVPSERDENKADSTFRRVYNDTTYFIDSIVEEYDIFPTILRMMRDGNATIELKKRYLLRAIDEAWVNIIEDTLPSLDIIIRNPSKYIEEHDEVLPIELSRNISVRSLQHLSQHTNLISRIEGDTIIPSKILNVFRDETMQTYENKFINTLINRLYAFVNRRYEIARKAGQDEKTTSIEFKDSFDHDKVKVNMNFRLEIAESAEDEEDQVERNYSRTTSLWHRVEKLNSIVTAYADSEFVHNMGQSYIRPPVMRTNAILKNKDLRQCLTLWQFIESYESAGYSMLIQEDLEDVDEGYIKELYSTLALQYLIFRYNIRNEFEADHTLASELSDNVIAPRIIDNITDMSSSGEFDIVEERSPEPPAVRRYNTLTPDDRLMLKALEISLDAQEIISAGEQEAEYEHPFVPEPDPVPEAPAEPDPDETSGEVSDGSDGVSDNGASDTSVTDGTESVSPDAPAGDDVPQTDAPAATKVKVRVKQPRKTKRLNVRIKESGAEQ